MWSPKHIVLFILCTANSCEASKHSSKSTRLVYFLSSNVTFNANYLQEFSVIVAPDHQSLNSNIILAKNFSQDHWAELRLAVKNRQYTNYRNLFSYNVNMCCIIAGSDNKLNDYVLQWINRIWKYSNVPKQCPIKKANYTFSVMSTRKLHIPGYIPSGKYRLTINTYFPEGTLRYSISNCTLFMEVK